MQTSSTVHAFHKAEVHTSVSRKSLPGMKPGTYVSVAGSHDLRSRMSEVGHVVVASPTTQQEACQAPVSRSPELQAARAMGSMGPPHSKRNFD